MNQAKAKTSELEIELKSLREELAAAQQHAGVTHPVKVSESVLDAPKSAGKDMPSRKVGIEHFILHILALVIKLVALLL